MPYGYGHLYINGDQMHSLVSLQDGGHEYAPSNLIGANVARRASGGPSTAEPGADVGPAAAPR